MRVGIDFTVQDEARFLSHHDTMRLLARAAGRATLPIRFTQGFNPHPRFALPLPRPTGVGGLAERAVLELTESLPSDEVADRLRDQLPPGMKLTAAVTLPGRVALQASSADYALSLAPEQVEPVRRRLAELAELPEWPRERVSLKARGASRSLDMRGLVSFHGLQDRTLRFTLTPHDQVWARVEEVLQLLGLAPSDRSGLVRTSVAWVQDASHNTSDEPRDAANGE
jgi:radical SAM-linked protein